MKTRYMLGVIVAGVVVVSAICVLLAIAGGLILGPQMDNRVTRTTLRGIVASEVSEMETCGGIRGGEGRARELLLIKERAFTADQLALAQEWLANMRAYTPRRYSPTPATREAGTNCVESGRRLIRALE
jgi:hypothetical protein